MVRVKCTISYDGTHFNGFQIQPDQRTVQGVLEHVLWRMHKQNDVRVTASGRTDSGVHAKGQVIHFTSPLDLAEANWKKALNSMMPPDIYVDAAQIVSDTFHARYDAVAKEYHYVIHNAIEPDIFKRHFACHYPGELNIQQIKSACTYLEGTHDFTTFSSPKASAKGSKIRTLYTVRCDQAGTDVIFTFYGSGFLYNMARILTRVLLDVGAAQLVPEDIPELFRLRDRRHIGATAPAQGLYLWRVDYPD